MAPVPEYENQEDRYITKQVLLSELTGDEIVISGISGQFPKSENMMQFMENLYGKEDMLQDNDIAFIKHPDLPKRIGRVKNWDYFDAQFFRVTPTQANEINCATRLLLENAYGAMFDSGSIGVIKKLNENCLMPDPSTNTETLNGTNMGVFIGGSLIDASVNLYDSKEVKSLIVTGFNKTRIANRISYWANTTGPSFAVESGCTSTMLSLELAYRAMKSGECECAIVGVYNNNAHPVPSINMRRHGLLRVEKEKRYSDETDEGYVRADVAAILFLQKAKDAKRIYAEVCGVKGKYFPDPDGNFLYARNPNHIEEFLQEFYSEIKLSPHDVDFVEANLSGIMKSDMQELEAIKNFFGNQKPIKVGNVKSNMGHAENGSGISALIKVCLAFKKGIIPADLRHNEMQHVKNITNDSKLCILQNHTPIKRGSYAAINNFSYTGTNYHVLLKDHHKSKVLFHEKVTIPHLILVSGRQDESINKIFDYLGNNSVDIEQNALLQNVFERDIPGHTARGYIILGDSDATGTAVLNRHIEHYPGDKRPVWFLYSGIGSQWSTMGMDLMKIQIFAQSIEKCHKILSPLGVDLLKIITDTDETIFDNVLNCFVGIAAIQIGLTDVLKKLGIVPNNIIGHSLGELGCAYADGCLTADETILSAYYRGLVSVQTKFIKGSMAAVGIGYKAILKHCPSEIEVACRNSANSSTISGPADKIKLFVGELTKLGIFAKEVKTGNIAYHSKYIKEAGPHLLKYMEKVIAHPKLRSEKWLCTSERNDKWNSAKYASAEYFTNNLLNPVYFEETSRFIPKNALVIEIAPHGLLQAIVKRSHPECFHVPLTRQKQKDSDVFLLQAIGKIYEAGLNPKIQALYPEVKWPVSSETPLLSHIVGWKHSETWEIYMYHHPEKHTMAGRSIFVSIHDHDYSKYITNINNGINILTPAVILVFVWETLAMYHKKNYRDMSVTFNNVHFYSEVYVVKDELLKLSITIQKGSQHFEVTANNSTLIVRGLIIKSNNYHGGKFHEDTKDDIWLNGQDLYKLVKSRTGYLHKPDFQSLDKINLDLNKAYVHWKDDWIKFLDSLILLNAIKRNTAGQSMLSYIHQLIINVKCHISSESAAANSYYFVELPCESLGETRCGGVLLKYITFIENHRPVQEFIVSDKRRSKFVKTFKMNQTLEDKTSQIKLLKEKLGFLKWNTEAYIDCKESVKICFAAVSLDDCIKAVKNSSNELEYFGMDFSGVDRDGNAVMGVVSTGALCKYVSRDEHLTWPVPKHWSLEDAATVPLPYMHAYYILTIKCTLKPGDSVLVMGGAGSLGQALITLCLALNCEVCTTVSNEQKKDVLLRLFPNLVGKNIFYSRQAVYMDSFDSESKGYDVVINCCSGNLRKNAMKFVGPCGIFLDINETDMQANEDFEMSYLWNSKSYRSVRISTVFENNNFDDKKKLHERISEGIARGIVKPLTRVVFDPTEVNRAFRLLSSSGHRGRVLLDMTKVEATQDQSIEANRIGFSTNEVQIIAFNQIESAIDHVEYFANRGVKNFILFTSPQVIDNNYLKQRLLMWEREHLKIRPIAVKGDADVMCNELFNTSLNLESVRGVFIYLDKNSTEPNTSQAVDTVRILNSMRDVNMWRYFVVVAPRTDSNESFVEIDKICNERNSMGLHALKVTLLTHNFDGFNCNFYRKLENCINSNLSNITFQSTPVKMLHSTYKEKILSILALTKSDLVDMSGSLKMFNITDVQLQEIKSCIREYLNITYNVNALKLMSIESILNIGIQNVKSEAITGIKAFFNYFCDDHYHASEPIVTMSTLLSATIENDLDLDPNDTYLLMIPGFEGHSQKFESLAEKLKIKALTLQLDPDYNNDSIEKIAEDVLKYLKPRISIKSRFYILGYSFGVLVALEVASTLEKEGFVGIVYCLDSSPEAFKVQLDAYLGKLTLYELQNVIVTNFYELLIKGNSEELSRQLENLEDWQSKIQLILFHVKHKVSLPQSYLKNCLDSLYNRILLIYDYEANFKLNSELILIKSVPHPDMKALAEDYGLSKYTNEPVKVFTVESDHASILFDIKIPNIVNKTLDVDLQTKLKSLSYCDFYY